MCGRKNGAVLGRSRSRAGLISWPVSLALKTNLEDADPFVGSEAAGGQRQGFHSVVTQGESCKS